MKVIKTASGKKQIKMSKKEWLTIGKTAGWMESQVELETFSDIKTTISNFVKDLVNRAQIYGLTITDDSKFQISEALRRGASEIAICLGPKKINQRQRRRNNEEICLVGVYITVDLMDDTGDIEVMNVINCDIEVMNFINGNTKSIQGVFLSSGQLDGYYDTLDEFMDEAVELSLNMPSDKLERIVPPRKWGQY
jgi:hypothetical protein